MVETVWRCDICGKEYKTRGIPFIHGKYVMSYSLDDKTYYKVDLCRNCQKNLMQYLRDNIKQEDN